MGATITYADGLDCITRGGEYFYVGFRLQEPGGKPELWMLISMTFPDGKPQLAETLISLGGMQDGNDLNFLEKITGTAHDGNADSIRGWFWAKLAEISAAKQHSQ